MTLFHEEFEVFAADLSIVVYVGFCKHFVDLRRRA